MKAKLGGLDSWLLSELQTDKEFCEYFIYQFNQTPRRLQLSILKSTPQLSKIISDHLRSEGEAYFKRVALGK